MKRTSSLYHRPALWGIAATAWAMSLGWGIRGNYGHERGAMIAGALVGMLVCMATQRRDWLPRLPLFGLFGAVGWAFGGQMSYGILIGYTFSADLASVSYGFASLFLVGAVWGGIGAVFLSMAALWDRQRLLALLPPFITVLVFWTLSDLTLIVLFRETEPPQLDWYDSDWVPALVALVAVLAWALRRRKLSEPVVLMLHMILGWWAGMLLLVQLGGLHLSPPRSDNWAGALGLLAGLCIFLTRRGEREIIFTTILVALFGGAGFSTGELFQVMGRGLSSVPADWWKVMEQTFGLIMGAGVAIGLLRLRARAPVLQDDRLLRPWAEPFAVFFLLIIVSYLNFSENPGRYVAMKSLPASLFGPGPGVWFALAYLIISAIFIAAVRRHRRTRLPLVPPEAAGQGQLLSLAFLWLVVIGDLSGAFPFGAYRLFVQGSFFLLAAAVTVWLLFSFPAPETFTPPAAAAARPGLRTLLAAALAVFFLLNVLQTTVALHVIDKPLPGAHLRFGPESSGNN